MLPEVAVFDSALVRLPANSESQEAPQGSGLFESLQSLRSFVQTESRKERQREAANPCNLIESSKTHAPGLVWGEHGRRFELTANGCARYDFRSCETLRSVVTDLISACQKSDHSVLVNYATIRSACAEILAYNNIDDPDLIEAGSELLIPSSLVPRSRNMAA
ncbi:hypothetical protein BH10CYA1_BH10CYA1_32620 [soil metagenome]